MYRSRNRTRMTAIRDPPEATGIPHIYDIFEDLGVVSTSTNPPPVFTTFTSGVTEKQSRHSLGCSIIHTLTMSPEQNSSTDGLDLWSYNSSMSLESNEKGITYSGADGFNCTTSMPIHLAPVTESRARLALSPDTPGLAPQDCIMISHDPLLYTAPWMLVEGLPGSTTSKPAKLLGGLSIADATMLVSDSCHGDIL